MTFLVQHSAGLSGMPRRVYEYADDRTACATYNLISSIGSWILAIGVLLTVINLVRSVKNGRDRGPGPVEGQHARVVHAVAAAGEQLRRDPARALGRADEGHPPPGRAGDRRRAALPGRAAASPRSEMEASRVSRQHAWPLAGRPPGGRRLRRADQAARPVAAAADDDHDDVRGGRPVARRWSR